MTDTQKIFEEWKRETRAEGRAEGLAEGAAQALAQGLVVVYEIRFGAMSPELKTAVEATKEAATLLEWLRLIETKSAETFAATVLASRAG